MSVETAQPGAGVAKVRFTRMADGTAEDYAFVAKSEQASAGNLALRLLEELKTAGDMESAHQITRYEHSLQTATRALRDDADEETVVCALLHDIGDGMAPDNHSEFAAAILRPYVSEANHWVVKHHGIFQGYYYFHHYGGDRNARERYKHEPHYQPTIDFCHRWDQESFDPHYDTLSIDEFRPLVERILARAPRTRP